MNLELVVKSWGRAVIAQFNRRIILLNIVPFLVALVVWAAVMVLGLQALVDWLHLKFVAEHVQGSNDAIMRVAEFFAVKAFIAPLLAMWLLLPLMIFSALLAVTFIAMPVINDFVGNRHYPSLERRQGGSIIGSIQHSLMSLLLFAGLWIISLPLMFVPPLNLFVQPLLWGWLTYRIMSYDSLATHADESERIQVMRQQRPSLILIGTIVGLCGSVPGMLWMGGVLSVIFLPFAAGFALFIYMVLFVFSGLWFQFYNLEILDRMRKSASLIN